MDCLIIDDDKLSRIVLEEYIDKTKDLQLRASFANSVDAANYLSSGNRADLLFLDIEMPEMNGIDLLNSLKTLPQVIITSSREKYALQAFDFDVTDYLLKPISLSRFYKAVNKAKKRHISSSIHANSQDEIFIKKGSSLVKMHLDDILWIEALENYIVLNTRKEKFTLHFTMKALQDKLPKPYFTRIHRSYIVNTKNISVIRDNSVEILYDEQIQSLPIGKSYKENLMKDINLISR